MSWIDIKERLPEKPGYYWIFRIPKQRADGKWLASGVPTDVRNFDGEKFDSTQEVIAWSELRPCPDFTPEMSERLERTRFQMYRTGRGDI